MDRGKVKVKNKNAAEQQITAEQILRETHERQDQPKPVPKQQIADEEELAEYQMKKRKEFEEGIRRNRNVIGVWLKYAAWEETQKEYERARSVYERGLANDPHNSTLWLKYVETEMKLKNVNRARIIYNRVVGLLPRLDMFWYKYAYMEELLDNVAGARQVFERWMQWEPSEDAWMSFIKFEKRYNETERARNIFHRFVSVHPHPKNWLKWAKFEEAANCIGNAREIYEQCIETLGEQMIDQNIYVSFAKFEVRMKEFDRARAIFKYGLEKLPKAQAANLYNEYALFEKQYGHKEGIEDVVLTKRRNKYEEEIVANPRNYDVWFDYIQLEEDTGNIEKTRKLYERAVAQVPLIEEKKYWDRYVYIWLFFAVFEETLAKDNERAKKVYIQLIKLIPHKKFTFAKVWLQYAYFLVRRKELNQARKTLGTALGLSPKEKLFKGYIELELQLREFDRVRKLYEKYLEWNPANCYAWIKYSELERMLGDVDRARGIFDIAISQDVIDMPEVLWKGYIDFEVAENEWTYARTLYERLLEKTQHVKVWVSYAGFESSALDNGEEQKRAAKSRSIFERAYKVLKQNHLKEERLVLLEAWKTMENEMGTSDTQAHVESKMPRVVKKRRRVENDNGSAPVAGGAWEEYYDYIFPDDEEDKPNFKLLAMAHQWKMKMQQKKEKDNQETELNDDSHDHEDSDYDEQGRDTLSEQEKNESYDGKGEDEN